MYVCIYIYIAVDCEWGDWLADKAGCSLLCGTGTLRSTRPKTVKEMYGGTCTGNDGTVKMGIDTDEKYEPCNEFPCRK